ncbi:hypothetical protein [Streptomyces sp. sk2.1]|nr:hypothetical protein [Streptomyces sp. sk2.1]
MDIGRRTLLMAGGATTATSALPAREVPSVAQAVARVRSRV